MLSDRSAFDYQRGNFVDVSFKYRDNADLELLEEPDRLVIAEAVASESEDV